MFCRSFICLYSTQFTWLNAKTPYLKLYSYCHFGANLNNLDLSNSIRAKPPLEPKSTVAIFWDLDNKPPNSFPPYEAAFKLKKAASVFGFVKYMVADANRHAFSFVPQVVREQRKERKLLNRSENNGVIKPVEPYLCRVCGRRFCNNEKLINHFKQVHEREQQKRLNQIESARGKRRVNLVAKYAMKMQKYKNAARGVLTPKVGCGFADELKRAGFCIKTVSDRPQATDIALREHMVDLMDKRRAQCLVLVSDDSDFVGVLREAKLRCVKTVVVGDTNDGVLKRVADANFSWQEILIGKANKEAVSVAEKWKDRDILKRLEWTYNPEEEKKLCDVVNAFDGYENEDTCDDDESDDREICGISDEDEADLMQKDSAGAWWELSSDPKSP